MLTAAQSRGADFFEAQSNSPPYWMINSQSSTGAVGGCNNLASACYGTGTGGFADYLASVVQHFSSSFGIRFREAEPRIPATATTLENGVTVRSRVHTKTITTGLATQATTTSYSLVAFKRVSMPRRTAETASPHTQ